MMTKEQVDRINSAWDASDLNRTPENWGRDVKLNTEWAVVPEGVEYYDCQEDTYSQNTHFDHDPTWATYWNKQIEHFGF